MSEEDRKVVQSVNEAMRRLKAALAAHAAAVREVNEAAAALVAAAALWKAKR